MIYLLKMVILQFANCDRLPEGNPLDVRCFHQGTSDFLPFLAQNNTLIRNQLLAAPAFLGRSSSGENMLKNKTSKRPTSNRGWYVGLLVLVFCDWSIGVKWCELQGFVSIYPLWISPEKRCNVDVEALRMGRTIMGLGLLRCPGKSRSERMSQFAVIVPNKS